MAMRLPNLRGLGGSASSGSTPAKGRSRLAPRTGQLTDNSPAAGATSLCSSGPARHHCTTIRCRLRYRQPWPAQPSQFVTSAPRADQQDLGAGRHQHARPRQATENANLPGHNQRISASAPRRSSSPRARAPSWCSSRCLPQDTRASANPLALHGVLITSRPRRTRRAAQLPGLQASRSRRQRRKVAERDRRLCRAAEF
ncbi:hypothetical protein ABIB99_000769 [Bradyrhizobium sp. LA6.1]